MQAMGPAPGYVPGPPVKKRIHPIIWILVGLAALLLLVTAALVAVGFYVVHRFQENPAEVASAVLSTVNADLEVVSSDKERGTITLREKSTGKTTTLTMKDLKSSSFNLGTSGGEITLESGGQKVTIGGGKTPDWLPAYAGARVQHTVTEDEDGSTSGSYGFTTKDGASAVIGYYEQQLSKAGMQVTRPSASELIARDERREVKLTARMEGGGSRVILSYTAKD